MDNNDNYDNSNNILPIGQDGTIKPLETIKVVKTGIFIHRCCSDGIKSLRAFMVDFPDVKIKSYSMLQARDLGLHTKYKFDLADLIKYSYLIMVEGDKDKLEEVQVIKWDNKVA